MIEQKKIKKQILKNMFIICIVFILLFISFDFIVYNIVSNSIYSSVDQELMSEKNRYTQAKGVINKRPEENKIQNNIIENKLTSNSNENTQSPQAPMAPTEIEKNKNPDLSLNPRMITILRNSNGEITNEGSIGRIYDDYVANIEFDEQNLNNAYIIKVNEHYTYRAINFEFKSENGETIYGQFLINVDGEISIIKNLLIVLIICTIIAIVVSIMASYILSLRSLKPIIISWKKQTEFVQNASHELRTPLTIIQAKQELLLQEPQSKIIDKSEDIAITLNESKRLSKLVKELMDLARDDSNQIKIEKKDIKIDDLINEISIPYQELAKTENKDINIDLKYNDKINVDSSKIKQLMVILLDNSMKYTLNGDNIFIKTYKKDNKCYIEVIDTGIGIGKEAIKHVFERFYREDKARSREKGGNGLGLSIAESIVTAHKGNIKIMQNLPKGTKVIVKL